MAKFKVGDRVRWGKEPPDEIIEDIDNKGYIRGRYLDGDLSLCYKPPHEYTFKNQKRRCYEQIPRTKRKNRST